MPVTAEIEAKLKEIGAHLDALGWERRQTHPMHPGWCVEKGRLLRLAIYYRAVDGRWSARYGIQGAQLIGVESPDPDHALQEAHSAAVRELETLATKLQEMRS